MTIEVWHLIVAVLALMVPIVLTGVQAAMGFARMDEQLSHMRGDTREVKSDTAKMETRLGKVESRVSNIEGRMNTR
jgi:hypothetical protein